MKDLLERIFRYLPHYVPELASLIGRPKRTIIARNTGAPDDLTQALLFVGVSVAIGFVLQAPTLGQEHDFITVAGGMAAFKIVAIMIFSGIIWGILRLFGGTADYVRTLIAYLYAVSPAYLALIVLNLMSRGIIRAYDGALADQMRANPSILAEPGLMDSFSAQAPHLAWPYAAVQLLIWATMLVWPLICWGAFRHAHEISRLRSGLAYVAVIAMWMPYAFLLWALAFGIYGTVAPPIT